MRRLGLTAAFAIGAAPAFAASGGFFSLANTNFVVLIGFLLFVGVLTYFEVPGLLSAMLDKRAEDIRSRLEEARALREDAQTLLADFERKHKIVQSQVQSIVTQARADAQAAADEAKASLDANIVRKIRSAEEQIEAAEASAIRQVREQAITVAISAARDVIAKGMSADDARASIDESIRTVGDRLH